MNCGGFGNMFPRFRDSKYGFLEATAVESPPFRAGDVKRFEAFVFDKRGAGQSRHLTVAEFAELCTQNTNDSLSFRSTLTKTLKEVPFEAFVFETKGVSSVNALSTPFEFVVIDAPDLTALTGDWTKFEEHFRNTGGEAGVAFDNFKRDARLVVPLPTSRGSDKSAYVHLAAFVRHAPNEQVLKMWSLVAKEFLELLGKSTPRSVWLSTAVSGVGWLHFRLDESPTRYLYAPYKIGGNSIALVSQVTKLAAGSLIASCTQTFDTSLTSAWMGSDDHHHGARTTNSCDVRRSIKSSSGKTNPTGASSSSSLNEKHDVSLGSHGTGPYTPSKPELAYGKNGRSEAPEEVGAPGSGSAYPNLFYEKIPEDNKNVLRYGARDSFGNPVSIHNWAKLMSDTSQEGSLARNALNEIIKTCPFGAVFFETKGCNSASSKKEDFEFVLVNAPSLYNFGRRGADANTFARHFRKASRFGVAFDNLGGDARLVAPTPSGGLNYAHLTNFCKSASTAQALELWRLVATEYCQSLKGRRTNVWLSTSGLGVAWLHFRLDSTPKYYQYRPFASVVGVPTSWRHYNYGW